MSAAQELREELASAEQRLSETTAAHAKLSREAEAAISRSYRAYEEREKSAARVQKYRLALEALGVEAARTEGDNRG